MHAPSSQAMATWVMPSRATKLWSRTIGWEAVAVWVKAKGKDNPLYNPARKAPDFFMDCLVIPKDAPNIDLTYKMINHILSPEPQKIFATEQSAGITNIEAVPSLPQELVDAYGYASLADKLTKARLQPMPPTELSEWATYDDFLKEYGRIQKA